MRSRLVLPPAHVLDHAAERMFAGLNDIELGLVAIALKAGDAAAPDRPDKASTLYLTAQLTRQIQGYTRELDQIWNRAMAQLADAAGDAENNQILGLSGGDQRGDEILLAGVAAFTAAAVARFGVAWAAGRDLALQFMSKDRLTPSEQQAQIENQLARNELFVKGSLFTDIRDEYRLALRDPELTPVQTAEKVQSAGQGMLGRVGMYALKLWGVSHLAFAKELGADGRDLSWVLTSLAPCVDCPRLAKGGPYGTLHPLPTVPGLGDTECRTNCQCMLKET